MYCTAPSLSSEFNQSSCPLRIGLLMDGVTSLLELNTSLSLFPDPVFTRFTEERVFTSGDPIPLTIEGEGFVFTVDQVNVLIEPCNRDQSELCQCTVMNVFPNNVSLILVNHASMLFNFCQNLIEYTFFACVNGSILLLGIIYNVISSNVIHFKQLFQIYNRNYNIAYLPHRH